MKLKLFIATLCVFVGHANATDSVESSAEKMLAPWATLSVYPTSVDVRINNYENRDYTCSGNVYMYLQSGHQVSQYYYQRVFARSNNFRTFRNYNYNNRIVRASHSIYCY